jgi:exopolyphosphatase/guanosine-5'-triphosphate,3'-diphosphate pyrophosphatase
VVARSGRVTEEAADRMVATIRRFRSLADAAGAQEIVACATSALREADNSGSVVDRIEAEADLRVEVISGAREAELIFAAVRASVVLDPAPAVCFDLGGGSLEVMVGDASGLLWSTSLKLGVARLTAELVSDDPPSADDQRRLRARLSTALAPVADQVAAFEPHLAVGTSGTLCDLAAMAEGLRTGVVPASVNQLRVGRADLLAVQERIFSLPAQERQGMGGLEPRRVDLVPAGSMLLTTAMDLFGFEELVVGEWALREGIVLDAIGRHEVADWEGDPHAIRRSSVLGLARRCQWDEGHSSHVARLATDLFDQTQDLHGLGPDDRELLEYGALLHDIGEHVSVEGHHKHTAYLIENGKLRGFAPDEVAVLATLGRFHCRSEPKPSYEPFGRLEDDRRERVRRLLSLLRLADGLDRGHTGLVEGFDTEMTDSRVRIRVRARGDAELELWGLRRKRELFERLFERRLEVVEVPAEAVAAVPG